MTDHGGATEPQHVALQRILDRLTVCLKQLDELDLPHCAVRLELACQAVRDELGIGGEDVTPNT